MCTKTKTSYGCGHAFKSINNCSQHCKNLEKYHFEREGDCRDCKQGGAHVTRGKEGKGRYAQELKQRDSPHHPSPAPSTPSSRPPLHPLSTTFTPNPWAPPNRREKNWDRSPVRRQADDAWLREHDGRQRDLEARSSEHASHPSPASPSPLARRRRDRDRDHDHDDADAAQLRASFRHVEDVDKTRARRRADRTNSYDSVDSMDSARSVPRGRSFDTGFGASAPHHHYHHHQQQQQQQQQQQHLHHQPYLLALPYRGLGEGLDGVVGNSSRPWGWKAMR